VLLFAPSSTVSAALGGAMLFSTATA
jgi:hypothetical protein